MYKGKDLIGKPIITFDNGVIIGKIKDIIFDGQKNVVHGFIAEEGGVFTSAQMIPFERVKSVGEDALTIPDQSAVMSVGDNELMKAMDHTKNIAIGTKVMTEEGSDLGKIADLYFDEKSGKIEGYKVSGGMFSDAYSGSSFLPAPDAIKIGEDVAFVPAHTAQMMEEQIGGLKGVVQNAGSKVLDAKDASINKLSEVKDASMDKLSEAKDASVEKFNDIKQSVDMMKGKRVYADIRDELGSIFVAAGQIVTQPMIEKAKLSKKETDLVAATSPNSAMESKVGQAKSVASSSVGSIKESASNMWRGVKEKTSEFKNMTADKYETSRIESALGKPVTKVILDPQDDVILDVGQLVTHEAVNKARSTGVLNMLLDSVSNDEPKFSSDELKAKKLDSNPQLT